MTRLVSGCSAPALLVLGSVLLIGGGCDDKSCPPNSPCPTPTPVAGGSCAVDIGGSWNESFLDTCRSGAGMMAIAQSRCEVRATVPSLGTLKGMITGSSFVYTITFASPCGGTASGTATIPSGGIVDLPYKGTET